MATRYRNILTAFYADYWAILPSKLAAIEEFLQFQANGGKLTPIEVNAKIGTRSSSSFPVNHAGDVAVIELIGVLVKRAGMVEGSSGGTSIDRFGQQFDSLMQSNRVGAIVIDVDSPGGSVMGITELAGKIRAARGIKPVVAIVNGHAASAAYWVASAAERVVATSSSEVGSIGTIALHSDTSGLDAQKGIKRTVLTAGRRKAERNSFEPLSDEARQQIQSDLNRHYDMFVADVAAGRGVSVATVKKDFGEGIMFGAKDAVKLGMIDGISSTPQEIDRLLKGARSRSATQARADALRSMELDGMAIDL